MSERQTVEARSVTMYKRHWDVVDQVAQEVAKLTGSVSTSAGLRVVVDEYRELKARQVQEKGDAAA